MRVAGDLTYQDLGLVKPEGGNALGERVKQESGNAKRKVPKDSSIKLINKGNGTVFTFKSQAELLAFKY